MQNLRVNIGITQKTAFDQTENRNWYNLEKGKDLPDAMVKRRLSKKDGDRHHHGYGSARALRSGRYSITGP